MSTTEIREKLHQYIDHIDEHFLKAVHALVEEYAEGKTTLSENEKKAVDKGLKSLEKGNVFSHEKVMAEMKNKYPDMVT